MREYQISKFARTRKKAGWDCVRHLEIMAASCLPVFQNIEQCPKYTMVHYPKNILGHIRNSVEKMTDAEYDQCQKKVYTWLSENLTSNAMGDYMLRMTNNQDA